jgi:hypothetical protein
MADEEQKLKRLYGKLPSKKNILGHKLQVSHRDAEIDIRNASILILEIMRFRKLEKHLPMRLAGLHHKSGLKFLHRRVSRIRSLHSVLLDTKA